MSQLLGLPIGAYLATNHYSTPFFTIGICSGLLIVLIYMTLPQLRPVEQTKVRNKSIMNRYKGLLQERKVSYSFLRIFSSKQEILQHFRFWRMACKSIWITGK